MSNINVTTNTNDINVEVTDNQINITPTATQVRVFAGGYAQPGGSNTEIQYNNNGVLAGAANITYTNGSMLISNNNFKITGGNNGYFLQTDGNGNLTWYPGTAFPTGNGTVGGANGQIQFNNAGNFGGLAGFTANVINNNVSMPNNLAVVGNITANYFIGNGSQLTGINTNPSNIANGNSNVSVAANSNITFGVAGNANVVTVTGNGIVLDNGTGGTISGANLVSANIISATGNITANYFIGNGSQLTGIDTSQISNGNSNVRVFANSDVTISIGGFANILKVDSANSTITTTYDVNVGGGVTATQFYGSGQNLSNITGANVTGVVANANIANTAYSVDGANVVGTVANANYAAYAGNATVANTAYSVDGANVSGQVSNALVAGTVYANAQPNITSVGTLTSLSSSGNITANRFIGNGATLTNLTGANITGQVGNALVAGTVYTNAQPNITSVGTLTGLLVNGQLNVVAVTNLIVPGGINGQFIKTDGNGNLSFGNVLVVGGANSQIQFNDNGVVNANANLTFTKSTGTLFAQSILSNNSNLGNVGNVKIGGGTNGYFLQTDGGGNLSWVVGIANATGNGSVGGANSQIQFNDNGNFAGAAGFTYNNVTNEFSVPGSITVAGNITTTGTTTIQQTKEKVVANASPTTGTVNFNLMDSAFLIHTANSSANFTLNLRGNSTVTLDSMMNVDESLTCTMVNKNGVTPRIPTTIQIDGSNTTPSWSGNGAPTAGKAGGYDAYTFNILKTAANSYIILASQTGYL